MNIIDKCHLLGFYDVHARSLVGHNVHIEGLGIVTFNTIETMYDNKKREDKLGRKQFLKLWTDHHSVLLSVELTHWQNNYRGEL